MNIDEVISSAHMTKPLSGNRKGFQSDGVLIAWLSICALLIFSMIVLGGVTRLTDSGLSIVEWEPLMGIIPPLNHQDWLSTLSKYQQFPEYKQVNSAITLSEFKTIYYFEYFHRLLGRIIGLAFIVPLIYFWRKGLLTRHLLNRLFVVFILGGVQGFLGWYMVQSGLVDEPQVSQYRLTVHLGLAVALYGYIVWLATGLYLGRFPYAPRRRSLLVGHVNVLIAIIYLMILSGGIVAGLNAGMMWNTFPLMGDTFFPPGLYDMSPAWLSAFENMTTAQFNHRMLAYTIFVIATLFLIRVLRGNASAGLRSIVIGFYVAICCQIALGITTLLFFVPVGVAALHQACAIIVFTLAVIAGQIIRNQKMSQ